MPTYLSLSCFSVICLTFLLFSCLSLCASLVARLSPSFSLFVKLSESSTAISRAYLPTLDLKGLQRLEKSFALIFFVSSVEGNLRARNTLSSLLPPSSQRPALLNPANPFPSPLPIKSKPCLAPAPGPRLLDLPTRPPTRTDPTGPHREEGEIVIEATPLLIENEKLLEIEGSTMSAVIGIGEEEEVRAGVGEGMLER